MSAMVVVDTIGAIAIGGAQAFTWLVVLFVTFFVPSALASAELGAAIPEEGGAYVWVRMAFGRFAGALTSLLYWAGTPMWLGGSVTVVAIAVWRALRVRPVDASGMLRVRRRCSSRVATLAAVVAAAVRQVGAVERRDRADRPARRSSRPRSSPTASSTASTASTLELRARRDRSSSPSCRCCSTASSASSCRRPPARRWSTRGATSPSRSLRAGVAQALMYGVPILAVLIVLPRGADHVAARADRRDARPCSRCTGRGRATALGVVDAPRLFIWVLLASGSAWIMGAGRAQAAACLDGGGPAILGRICERTGVPVVMGAGLGRVPRSPPWSRPWPSRGATARSTSRPR